MILKNYKGKIVFMQILQKRFNVVLVGILVLLQIVAIFVAAPNMNVSAAEKLKRQMEYLDRGLIALKDKGGIYIGWRTLGTEPLSMGFNIYRNGTKITNTPITNSTNYLDASGTQDSTYTVCAVIDGVEQEQCSPVKVWEKSFLEIPLQKPLGGTVPNYMNKEQKIAYKTTIGSCSTGDVDGDGGYELFVRWSGVGKDNGQYGYTSPLVIDCYKLDGTLLWRVNLGKNIRQGAHYNSIVVADFDGDGRAEMACKTADGTIDGLGNVIGDANASYVNGNGFILDGPEFLTVFDGQTGKALDTVDYDAPRGEKENFKEVWGDTYGNRLDRYLACAAWLDGVNPSFVMCRGYYTRMVLAAYDFKDGKITKRWRFDSLDKGNEKFNGQGNHNLSVGDVDGDGYDEVVYGAAAFDHDGKGMYSTGFGHGDAMHLGVHDPDRPGYQVWEVHEANAEHAYELHDAKTGEVIWYGSAKGDNGRGVAAHIDSDVRGSLMWSAATGDIFDNKGTVITRTTSSGEETKAKHPSFCFATWWGPNLNRYLLDGTKLDKWNSKTKSTERAKTFEGVKITSGTKASPCLQADLFGDWREEIIFSGQDDASLRIYTTTDVTEHKIYTLMHDPMYRAAVAWQNVGYHQPPHVGFYIGDDMGAIPVPNITAPKMNVTPKGVTTFTDLSNHWARRDILAMNALHIVKGMNDTEFMPEGNITRSQFLALVIRASNLEIVKYKGEYSDVSSDSWYADILQTAINNEIVNEKMLVNKTFKPNELITREEMTSIIMGAYRNKVAKQSIGGSIDAYNDKNEISDWIVDDVKAANKLKIINGVDKETFAPKKTATRAQAAVIVKRFYASIDNGSPNAEISTENDIKGGTFKMEGKWSVSGLNGANPEIKTYYTDDFRTVAKNKASWSPDITEPCEVKIYVYKITNPKSVVQQYEISYGSEKDIKEVDFTSGTSGWVELGTYNFKGSKSEGVSLVPMTGNRVGEMRFEILSGSKQGKAILVEQKQK